MITYPRRDFFKNNTNTPQGFFLYKKTIAHIGQFVQILGTQHMGKITNWNNSANGSSGKKDLHNNFSSSQIRHDHKTLSTTLFVCNRRLHDHSHSQQTSSEKQLDWHDWLRCTYGFQHGWLDSQRRNTTEAKYDCTRMITRLNGSPNTVSSRFGATNTMAFLRKTLWQHATTGPQPFSFDTNFTYYRNDADTLHQYHSFHHRHITAISTALASLRRSSSHMTRLLFCLRDKTCCCAYANVRTYYYWKYVELTVPATNSCQIVMRLQTTYHSPFITTRDSAVDERHWLHQHTNQLLHHLQQDIASPWPTSSDTWQNTWQQQHFTRLPWLTKCSTQFLDAFSWNLSSTPLLHSTAPYRMMWWHTKCSNTCDSCLSHFYMDEQGCFMQ
jgi:hypothetical protein